MPRRPPINPEGYYHVSTRGNFGRPLFELDWEHQLYLDLYGKTARKLGWQTLTYALIWNHHHFVLKLANGGLSEGMRAVNHGFARRLNAYYGRTGKGHMVRHCFFARELEDDGDLLTVCRYVDRNPVAAGRCQAPEDWPWSGYPATAGIARPRAFHDPRVLLSFFGRQPQLARRRYADFVAADPSLGTVTKAQRPTAA